MDENHQEIVSLANILIQSLSHSTLPFRKSIRKFCSKVILDIKPTSIFLDHSICRSTNASIIEDDLVNEIPFLGALEFGEGTGELGDVRGDAFDAMVGGLPCSIAADNQSLHLVGFEFLLGNKGGRSVKCITWLRDERVRGDWWWYEFLLWLHDCDEIVCVKETSVF